MPDSGEDVNGQRPRVVIVGAGFAGLTVAKRLAKTPADITLIDRQNHHLFQPLLYQVATAGLSPADIAWPIRSLVRHQRNTRVLLGAVTGVDRERKHVIMDGRNIAYDVLVLATGASHGYFGQDRWAAHAPGLKTVDDATEIRRRLLLAFERAEMESDAPERERLLTIVIVGGGPTGVEMAGAVVELARKALAADFRTIDPQQTHVLLVEAAPRLLASFPESLSCHAEQALRRLGVDVRLNQSVTECAAFGVTLGDERVDAATVIWAAGVTASPAAAWLAVAGDRVGRVLVGPDLQPPALTMCSSSATRRSPMTLPARHSPASPRSPSSRAPTWPQSSRRASAARGRRQPSTTGTKACSQRLAARPPSSRSDACSSRDG